jgi:hypothetical protein
MDEIVIRVRRRTGVSRVQVECEWRMDGRIVAEAVPSRVPLANGVSGLTFERACALFDGVVDAVRKLDGQLVLFRE